MMLRRFGSSTYINWHSINSINSQLVIYHNYKNVVYAIKISQWQYAANDIDCSDTEVDHRYRHHHHQEQAPGWSTAVSIICLHSWAQSHYMNKGTRRTQQIFIVPQKHNRQIHSVSDKSAVSSMCDKHLSCLSFICLCNVVWASVILSSSPGWELANQQQSTQVENTRKNCQYWTQWLFTGSIRNMRHAAVKLMPTPPALSDSRKMDGELVSVSVNASMAAIRCLLVIVPSRRTKWKPFFLQQTNSLYVYFNWHTDKITNHCDVTSATCWLI